MKKPADFPLSLLQAINDWQIGGGQKKKIRNAQNLKREAAVLPKKFRQCKSICYRQLALKKGHIYQLNDTLQLPESISAWTVSSNLAQQIKGGVPPDDWQGIIFELLPPKESVIINLDRLYNNSAFRQAVSDAQGQIHCFGDGIGRYKNTQREVVIEIPSIHIHQITALGGYSGTRNEIAEIYYGRNPTFLELINLDALIVKAGTNFGPSWISGAAKDRCIAKIQAMAPMYRQIKQIQSNVNQTENESNDEIN